MEEKWNRLKDLEPDCFKAHLKQNLNEKNIAHFAIHVFINNAVFLPLNAMSGFQVVTNTSCKDGRWSKNLGLTQKMTQNENLQVQNCVKKLKDFVKCQDDFFVCNTGCHLRFSRNAQSTYFLYLYCVNLNEYGPNCF